MTSTGGRRLAATQMDQPDLGGGCITVSLSAQGARYSGPALAAQPVWLLNLVITRGTPPRLEGCRPASRGLTLALMTDLQPIAWRLVRANSEGLSVAEGCLVG
jgi:hypothetical protein